MGYQQRALISQRQCDDFDLSTVDEGTAGCDPIGLAFKRFTHQGLELAQTRFDEVYACLQGDFQWRPRGIDDELSAGLLRRLSDTTVEIVGHPRRKTSTAHHEANALIERSKGVEACAPFLFA